MKMKKLLTFSVCVITLILLTVTSVAAAEIFVSSTGSDSNDGLSESTPVATFEQAYALIGNENGTIKVLDNMTYSAAGAAHTGVVTVKGKTASVKLTLPSQVSLNGKTTFETLTLSGTSTIYANANALVVQSDVTSDSLLTVYGGKYAAWSSSTSVKLYGGQYSVVYGGGAGTNGGVSNSEVVLGGNANPNDSGSDNGTCTVYGGADHQYATNTKVTIEGNAKAKYVYGSGYWGGSATTKVYIKGGEVMNVYGGSHANQLGNETSNASTFVEMTGGKAEAIFGANFVSSSNGTAYGTFYGNTKVVITGGEVTRRVYSGSYNDGTSLSVVGSTLLVAGPDARLITGSGLSTINKIDSTIYAGSRYANSSTEMNTMLFLDGCYDTFKSKISSSSKHNYIVKDTVHGSVAHVNGSAGNVMYIKADLNYVGRIGTKAYNDGVYTLTDAVTTVDFVKPVVVENNTITVNVDNQTIDLAKYESKDATKIFNGWKNNGTVVGASRVITANAGDVFSAEYINASLADNGDIFVRGAQLREKEGGAYDLRFVTRISKALLNSVGITTYGGENVKYGHVVIPKEELYLNSGEIGEITANNATGDNDVSAGRDEYLELDKETFAGTVPSNSRGVKLFDETDDYIEFTVCITNISNDDRYYAVRPYIKYTDYNGVEKVIYGNQYSEASVNSVLAEINK